MACKYFAYGSNLWQKQMTERCPEHKKIGLGRLIGYRWMISTRGYANVVISPKDYVEGIIYDISQNDENTLDTKEGVTKGSYNKEYLTVQCGGFETKCLVYIDPIIAEGKAKQEYINRINAGIVDANFAPEYVNKYIRPFIPENTRSQ